jgi:hypothetical protein
MSPGHLAPDGPAHATIPFRRSPGAAFPATADASRQLLSRGHIHPTQRQPVNRDYRSPGNRLEDRSEPKISTLARKAAVFPLPLLASPRLPTWLPATGLSLQKPRDGAHGNPSGKIVLSAENIGISL